MARKIFVVSDTHFGHQNIIKYCDRPYESAEEMDWDIVRRWNSVVSKEDIVYHLGDVYMKGEKGYIDNVLSSLNGRKRLILGNHDNGKDPLLHRHFEKILVWRMFPEFGVLLSHVPVHPGSLREKCPVNVHGHVHQNSLKLNNTFDPRYKNVSVEVVNYTPIDIESLNV